MLTIVTITYNNFEDLKSTIDSLSGLSAFEHIVVNGGSCDKTLEYLSSYKPPYKHIVINEADKGIYDAFNKGIKNSTGDWIQFLNSGDRLYSKEYLIKASKVLSEDNEISFVHGNIIFKDERVGEILMKPSGRDIGRGLPFQHPSMVVRKKVLTSINSFDDSFKLSADFDLVLRLLKENHKGRYLPLTSVLMDGSGASVKHEWRSIKECFVSINRNNSLTPITLLTFFERILFYTLRGFFKLPGLSFFFRRIKRLKYKQ